MKYTIHNAYEHPFNQDEGFQEAIQAFVEMRRKSKKPMTERAIKLGILKLIDLADEDVLLAIKIIDRSIFHGWLGFYPYREDTNPSLMPRELN